MIFAANQNVQFLYSPLEIVLTLDIRLKRVHVDR